MWPTLAIWHGRPNQRWPWFRHLCSKLLNHKTSLLKNECFHCNVCLLLKKKCPKRREILNCGAVWWPAKIYILSKLNYKQQKSISSKYFCLENVTVRATWVATEHLTFNWECLSWASTSSIIQKKLLWRFLIMIGWDTTNTIPYKSNIIFFSKEVTAVLFNIFYGNPRALFFYQDYLINSKGKKIFIREKNIL